MRNNISIEGYLEKGWLVMLVVEAKAAPCKSEDIASAERNTGRKVTHAGLLRHPEEKFQYWYLVTSPRELDVIRRGEESGRKVIGQLLSIRCGAKDIEGDVETKDFVQNIKDLTGWKVTSDQTGYEFWVEFKIDGGSKSEGNALIEELRNILIALSIKNKRGFEIKQVSWSEATVANPLMFKVGKVETRPEFIDQTDLGRVRSMRGHDETDLLTCIAQLYCQVSPRARLIYGFSLMEDLLDSRNQENVLSKKEQGTLLEKINELDFVNDSPELRKKIEQALTNSYPMFKKNRNERISERVSKILSIDISQASKKIKEISKLRGKLAHSTKEKILMNNKEERKVLNACAFIEKILYEMVTNRDGVSDDCGGSGVVEG